VKSLQAITWLGYVDHFVLDLGKLYVSLHATV
jgi:hypothetical protein